jgi:hypothetical protein
MAAHILAYFSHSYRAEDRELNAFFWELLSDAGYFFTVDPQSKQFSIPYLESMMMRSNCFVAVIPRRQGSPIGCSPYILFEYGLAVQAQKPAVVFVEQDLDAAWFARDAEQVIIFNRQRLTSQRSEFKRAIQKLARRLRGERNPDSKQRLPCGLLIQSSPETEQVYSPALVRTLKDELRKYDRRLEVMRLDFDAAFQLCLELDQYDLLIVEIRDSLQVPWLAGYVLGRAMPTIRLCHLAAGETPETVVLPSVIAKHKPQPTDELPVDYWRDTEELLRRVTMHVSKFNNPRIEFHTKDAGDHYFKRAGRREAKVFVSNASGTNPLAQKLITQMRIESVDFFHYQVKDAIPIGDRWLEKLEEEIKEAGIFVALITNEFLKSRWCLYEVEVARTQVAKGRLRILSYVLEPNLSPLVTAIGLDALQCRDCSEDEPGAIVETIVKDLDRELRGEGATPVAPTSATAAVSRPPSAVPSAPPTTPSAADLVLEEEERRRLVEVVSGRLTTEDGSARPAWVKGLLMHALLYARLSGEDYSGSAQVVATTLVTKAEALGVLPGGQRAISQLVNALSEEGRVSQSALPFLKELSQRLNISNPV